VAVIDVLLVAYVNYRLLKLVRGKRAWRIVVGLLVFVAALALSDLLGLSTLHWLLEKATVVVPIAVVVLLLPELRQAFEGVGKLGGLTERLITPPSPISTDTVSQICAAVSEMAENRTGALIVVERGTLLQDIADNGVTVNAKVTAPLLGAIFYHGNPLHDGAVLVRGDRIIAAACRLPMSDSTSIGPHYHMRHRAGVGMSEHSDAIVLIVSEERGEVSVAVDGILKVVSNDDELRRLLTRELVVSRPDHRHRRRRRRRERVAPPQEVAKK
jgi:diadenylate cyclase